ncbi:MAG: hypothetical protein JNM76_09475 [Betaproteobacteria bacterium]|nr:hypothetical protein [Betaproteobacteria bacterium]
MNAPVESTRQRAQDFGAAAHLRSLVLELTQVAARPADDAMGEALARLAAQFDEALAEQASQLLGQIVLEAADTTRDWEDHVRASADFAAVARQVAQKVMACRELANAERAVAGAWGLAATGNAIRARLMAQRPPAASTFAELGSLLQPGLSQGLSEQVVRLVVGGDWKEATLESLFLRAHLLMRLAGGCLSNRQVQILDDWLWAWMPALCLRRSIDEDTTALYLDPARAQGLDICGPDRPAAARAPLYFTTRALARQVDHAVDWFQQGRIFPGEGLGASFRLEEHLGVINFLNRELGQICATAKRAERHPVEIGVTAEAWFGFHDVVARALKAPISPVGSAAAPLLADVPGGDAFADPARYRTSDSSRRAVTVRDASAAGLGLALDTAAARQIAVGDIAGIRLEPRLPVVLAVVMRVSPGAGNGQSMVGVEFIGRRVRALALEPAGGGKRPPLAAVHVAGDDPGGFADALIVSEVAYRSQADLLLRDQDECFRLRLGRIRRQGRGWKMAAYSVHPC